MLRSLKNKAKRMLHLHQSGALKECQPNKHVKSAKLSPKPCLGQSTMGFAGKQSSHGMPVLGLVFNTNLGVSVRFTWLRRAPVFGPDGGPPGASSSASSGAPSGPNTWGRGKIRALLGLLSTIVKTTLLPFGHPPCARH